MIEHEGWPVVAIVGRPNVGKSTLLNRIVGRREAIVEEKPGVTRDRKEVEAEWNGRQFIAVDTGGWLPSRDTLDAKVSEQSERAMRSADVIMLVVDAAVGVIEEDAQVASVLRKLGRPVVVVANKIDDANRESAMWDFLEFGLGEPSGISALHGRGTGDLLDRVVALLPATAPDGDQAVDDDELEEDVDAGPRVFAVAIVGRPNVGKSTLFNRLIGDDRAVVHDMPGTTRDAIDTVVETDEGPIRFVDTAGMRRRSRIDEGTEYYSLVRALQAVDRSDVALLVIDATEGVTAQDQRLAERIDAAGCPIVILLNKWETLDADEREVVTREVGRKLHFTANSVVLKVSALTGKGVHRLLPALGEAIEAYHTRIPTKKVNDVVRAAQSAQPAPHGARVLYATQGAADPPTFTLFTNRELPPTYMRYLERKLREAFDLGPTPIKLRVRRRSE
ncbi:MAG: GTPase [Acidimicrobiaceae bacterium]|jgi:GTP-binding protein